MAKATANMTDTEFQASYIANALLSVLYALIVCLAPSLGRPKPVTLAATLAAGGAAGGAASRPGKGCCSRCAAAFSWQYPSLDVARSCSVCCCRRAGRRVVGERSPWAMYRAHLALVVATLAAATGYVSPAPRQIIRNRLRAARRCG